MQFVLIEPGWHQLLAHQCSELSMTSDTADHHCLVVYLNSTMLMNDVVECGCYRHPTAVREYPI